MLGISQQLAPLQAPVMNTIVKLTVEEQVAIIQKTMMRKRDSDDVPHYRFSFGCHRGRLLSKVVESGGADYLLWCYHADIDLPARVLTYIENTILTETTKVVQ